MVKHVTITVDVPPRVFEAASREADAGDTTISDQLTDRLRWEWETDPRA